MAVNDVKAKDSYLGEKRHQIRDGFGIYFYENKYFRYEGEWKDGKKHGHGLFVMNDGSYYEGEFVNGEIEGHGTRFFAATGCTYRGTFHQGELTGQGVMAYANGATYEGEWYQNKREGYGIFQDNDGSVYQGYFHNNYRHGEGKEVNSAGDHYVGDWVNDKRQGHGELKKADGTVYDGQWINNTYNGEGKIAHVSGMTYNGLWINGMPSVRAHKLVIKGESMRQIEPDARFSIEVECVSDAGELVQDNGRKLHIMAGFRSTSGDKVDKKSEREINVKSGALFNVIEEVEEECIETPYGYSVVSYPLTDQIHWPPEVFQSKAIVGSLQFDSASTSLSEFSQEGIPIPVAVADKHTIDGKVTFSGLILPSPPPVYQPFVEDEQMKENLFKQTTSKMKVTMKDADSQAQKTLPILEQSSTAKATDSKNQENMTCALHSSSSPEFLDRDLYAPEAEYVIMVSDVTSPPFLDTRLLPAFVIVRVIKKIQEKSSSPVNTTSKRKGSGTKKI